MFLSLNSWPKVVINDYRAVTFKEKDKFVKFVVFVNETSFTICKRKRIEMLTEIIGNPGIYL